MNKLRSIALSVSQDAWGRVAIVYVALCAFLAICSAWGVRHFVSSFVLWLITNLIYLPTIFAPFAAAAWAGIKVSKLSRNVWVGWAVGILLAVLLSACATWLVSHIPGIGWRFSRMLSTRDGDY